ncbi:helix-turn-helix domain-containing protein [Teredinibacter sp. KSP-S5-2]|uniref:helix-turn-helix domain-containing protein n=1 Tax=Teredinibacter sp. KSP-S5-2 TaxID=3034506 RepID=UPI002934C121|nr:helix-turn-helix domain-containing protein [Teredinibacter sp. KSP-S5-2]WNO10395.1 helix-turn-helix domain-containing protein [Teredinibacter sp. KSP-S5-2]
MSLENEKMTQKEVAEYFGVTVRTVQRWRVEKIGPAYLQYPGRVRYLREDIEEYENRIRIPFQNISAAYKRRAS